MKKVKALHKGLSNGYEYDYFIGKRYVTRYVSGIIYHEPIGGGDAHYCDVEFDDKSITRIFNPDSVEFKIESEEQNE